MSQLRTLVLNESKITGSGLRHLPASVKSLWLPVTQTDDDGLKNIAHLTDLETLILSQTKITDKGLKHLENLSNLRKLRVEKTRVTSAGVARLKSVLPECQIHH